MTTPGGRVGVAQKPHHTAMEAAGYRAGPVWMRVVPSLVMVALGLWRLSAASYWRDEAATLTAVQRPFGQLLRMLGHVDAVHGVYYLVMWPVVQVAGPGEVATRLPSVVAMAVAAGLVAALGRRLVSPETGLAAGLIFAVLPQVSRYAQDARPYGMVVALAVAASYLLVRAIGTTGRRRGWLTGYAACLGVMGALEAFALLLIIAHATTVALACLRKDRGRTWPPVLSGQPGRAGWSLAAAWLAATTAAMVLASPVLVLGFDQRKTLGWLQRKPQGLDAVTNIWRLAGPAPMVLAGLLVMALGLAVSARAGRAGLRAAWPRQLTGLCIPWLLLPPAILIGVSFAVRVYTPRYVLYCLPALALLAGAGLIAACRAGKTRPERESRAGLSAWGWVAGTTALVVVAALGLGAQLKVRAPGGQGDNIRRVDRIVAANRQPGDAVIYPGSGARHFPAAYPYGLVQLDEIAQDKTPVQAGNLDGTIVPDTVVRQRLDGVRRVWLVGARGVPSPAILQGLGYAQRRAWRVGSFWLVLYQHAQR
jgi:mannosyltransferase